MKIHLANHKSTKDINQKECIVWGALEVSLQICKWMGVAPLKVIKRDGMRVVQLSPAMLVYGYVIAVALSLLILAGLILDLNEPANMSIRVSSQVATTVWLLDMIVVFLISTLGNIFASRRMKHLIDNVNFINKIITRLNNGQHCHRPEKRRCLCVYMFAFVAFFINFLDVITYISNAIYENQKVIIVYLYMFYNVQCFITILMKMQFVLEALLAHTALKHVNDVLEGIGNDLEHNRTFNDLRTEGNFITTTTLHVKEINSFIDSLNFNKNNFADAPRIYINKTNQTLRLLNVSYGSICDVIRQINTENEVLLILLLMSLLVHLVVTPYYLITYFFDGNIEVGPVILQLIWCVYHVVGMIMIVEPGHRTQLEMERTQKLIGKLFSQSNRPNDQLTTELDLFQRQITLNQVMYAPMGICVLTRPLIASILGGVTTYLVIIVQFQAMR